MGSEEMTCYGCDNTAYIRTTYICDLCGNGYCDDCCEDNITEMTCRECAENCECNKCYEIVPCPALLSTGISTNKD